jgi:ADP-ribose pyrophosphatase YjhB (NUDIX family)
VIEWEYESQECGDCHFLRQGLKHSCPRKRRPFEVRGKYGFFGGRIREGETPGQAMERELLEEVGFVPEELDYWLKDSYVVEEEGEYNGWLINCHVFLSPATSELEDSKISEGKGIVKMSLEKVIKGDGFPQKSTEFLKGLRAKLGK